MHPLVPAELDDLGPSHAISTRDGTSVVSPGRDRPLCYVSCYTHLPNRPRHAGGPRARHGLLPALFQIAQVGGASRIRMATVRDAEVAGSNPAVPTSIVRARGLPIGAAAASRSSPSIATNPGRSAGR